jgi:integration host factor subunit alpha
MTTLTKASLAETLNHEIGLNKRESKELIEMFFAEVGNALEQGDSVKLSGFGNFSLREKNPRPGRNPKTGEEIPISARRVVTFKPGLHLKGEVDAVTGGKDVAVGAED